MSGVESARLPDTELDAESAGWLRRLGAGGTERWAAQRELHTRLVRIALAEVQRRQSGTPVTGPELDDIAHQAATDAILAILAKLGGFRGESRFTTWAYRFVILEVSSKLGRRYWRDPPAVLERRASGSASPTGSAWTRSGTRRRQESSPRYAASSTTS